MLFHISFYWLLRRPFETSQGLSFQHCCPPDYCYPKRLLVHVPFFNIFIFCQNMPIIFHELNMLSFRRPSLPNFGQLNNVFFPISVIQTPMKLIKLVMLCLPFNFSGFPHSRQIKLMVHPFFFFLFHSLPFLKAIFVISSAPLHSITISLSG